MSWLVVHTRLGWIHIDMSASPATSCGFAMYNSNNNNTGSVRVWVALKYTQFLCVPLFLPWKQQKGKPESFDINNYVIIMVQVM